MKTNSGFDFLAPVYDSMARIVFGKAIVQSQAFFLHRIPVGAEILILGGGTGWLLEKISDQRKFCKILYIDVSEKMIRMAGQRDTQDAVSFIQGTEQDIPKEKKFDVIITNFYFDLFSDKNLIHVLEQIQTHTKASSVWLVADFVETAWWHRAMLNVMYLFFRLVTGIDGSRLPQWNNALKVQGWTKTAEQLLYHGFINTSFWVR